MSRLGAEVQTGRRKRSPVHKEKFPLSESYWNRTRGLIPCGTQTLSKSPTQYVDGLAPKFLKRGKGCHVWDVDGHEFIDYGMGLHPIILGYAYPAVNEAIQAQLSQGITFTLNHPLEVELAETLREIIPCAEMVRYGKNGSDVTTAAIRVARAYTGRDKVACCGYHGWQDWYIGSTERNKGVPGAVRALTKTFEYNRIETLHQLFRENKGEIAAVIMEPVGAVPPENHFLHEVKALAHQEGAVFILDEIITGFRFALGGAQDYFGVIPDLATFGKAMSNGMPLSALVGKGEIMNELEEVFFSFTFGGEALSLAASLATLQEMKAKKVLDHVWKFGAKLQEGYNRIATELNLEEYTRCIGYPCRSLVAFYPIENLDPLEMKSLVQQELLKRGILWGGYHAMSFSHGEQEIEETLKAFGEALLLLSQAVSEKNIRPFLEGPPVRPVFRKV
jgi:glutamate-1-semialdehyde aminotransferase